MGVLSWKRENLRHTYILTNKSYMKEKRSGKVLTSQGTPEMASKPIRCWEGRHTEQILPSKSPEETNPHYSIIATLQIYEPLSKNPKPVVGTWRI